MTDQTQSPSPSKRTERPTQRTSNPTAAETPRRLVDRIAGPIDALHLISEADAEKANTVLERLVKGDAVEQEILEELLDTRPLAEPQAFGQLHRTFVRALEVYDRNARRAPSEMPGSFLQPVFKPVVTLLAKAMSNSFRERVVRDVRRLYMLREANSKVGSPEHRMLVTARRQLDGINDVMAGRGQLIPAFLVGGAAMSALVSVLNDLLHSGIGRYVLLSAVLLITVGAFWCLITAAAVTRRRTRLILDQPLTILWQAIGGAGKPPREPSRVFVIVATLLLLIGWVLAPLTLAIVLSLT